MLQWMVSQLCQQAGYSPPDLLDAYKKRHHLDTKALLDILTNILQKFETAYIVIDAIDESIPYIGLLAVLRCIMTESRFDKIRLLMTSRQYLDIEESLKPYATAISMANHLVQEDIRIYVASQLRSNPRFRAWPSSLSEEVEVALAKGAKGM